MSVATPLAATHRRDLRGPLLLGALLLLAVFALFWQDVRNMVATWSHSETFKHGFLILPLAGYLAYTRRELLRSVDIAPFPVALIGLALASLMWLAGWSADADVVRQFALIAMMIAVIATLFGRAFVWAFMGPLLYLLFAVPFGEILMLPLQEFTADAIVTGLNLSGIAVVRTGLFLSTGAGEFEVARACSGLRYLIASFALGTLFALLFIQSPRRRLLFIALSLIVPILANGVRAYLIVVIAHLSDLRIATGVDHLVYGWLFFGVVMFLLFWLGTRIAGPQTKRAAPDLIGRIAATKSFAVAAAAVVVLLLIAPTLAARIEAREAQVAAAMPMLVTAAPLPNQDRSWIPAFAGRTGLAATRVDGVDVAIAWYGHRDQGRLIGYENRDIDVMQWRPLRRGEHMATTSSGQAIPFATVLLESPYTGKRRLNWYVYRIGERYAANDYEGKAYEAWARIGGATQPKWSIALSVESAEPEADLSAVLEAFVRAEFERVVK